MLSIFCAFAKNDDMIKKAGRIFFKTIVYWKKENFMPKLHQAGLDAGCWMLDTGCWILDTRYWMLDAGCWNSRFGCGPWTAFT